MIKVYNPCPHVAYIIFSINKKRKKFLYSACGRISAIKEYCEKNKIDYSKCKDSVINGVHYLE